MDAKEIVEVRKQHRQLRGSLFDLNWISVSGTIIVTLIVLLVDRIAGFVKTAGLWDFLFTISSTYLMASVVMVPTTNFLVRVMLGYGHPKIFCNHCGKYVDYRLDWVCGFCGNKHHWEKFWSIPPILFSFLDKCQNCGQPPHALLCPRCDKLIYLDEPQQSENPAHAMHRVPPSPVIQPTPDELHLRNVNELRQKKEVAVLSRELEEEMANLKWVRKANTPPTIKPLETHLEESFEKYRDQNMAVDRIAKRALAQAEQEFSDDPDGLKKYKRMVEQWCLDNLR